MGKSLATGEDLTLATWDDFVTRLRHDCQGEGVRDHCTADAIFTVEAKRLITGIDKDLTDQWLVHCEDSEWRSPQAYWDDCDEIARTRLDGLAEDESDCLFLEMCTSAQWEILESLPDHGVTGWDERWEHVNSHFTNDAAEAFIKRKKHDYPGGLRVYVDSQCYAWEFNAIKDAIMSGRLTLSA